MLNSLKPVKNTTSLTANLTAASMLTPITSTKNKTNLMEASMLNTLKTNLILTRAVLIALFAGLFILAACGGGSKAAAPIVEEDEDEVVVNACDNNPFGTTCTRPEDATARATAITNCTTSYNSKASTQFDCGNVPRAVANCLRDPLATSPSRACDSAAYETARQGAGVTLATLTSTRRDLCRDDANRDHLRLCANTVVQNCDGDVSPFDLLCGRLNPARDAIIAKCVNGATLVDSTKNADCVAARAVGFTCFDNPWAESCLTSTMYREFAAFRADAQASRIEYCMGDDADTVLCQPALARVCSASGVGANPFSDLCTATNNTYASVRVAFATNCFNDEFNDGNNGADGADCTVGAFPITRVGKDELCGNGSDIAGMTPDHADCATTINVETCVKEPFSANCDDDIFAGARSARLDACTNGVYDGPEQEFYCGQAGGFSNDAVTCLGNPFTPDVQDVINCGTVLAALGDTNTLKTAQDNLIAACTGADADGTNTLCNVGSAGTDVARCLANPFTTGCDMTLGSAEQATTAKDNVIALCTTGDALTTNTICTGISAGTTKACISNPFGATCETDLGTSTQTTAQNNLIAFCTGTDAINTPNPLCSGITDTDVQACLDNPFTTTGLSDTVTCATALGGANIVMAAQNNLIEACTSTDSGGLSRCNGSVTVSGCLANPFGATCNTELGATQAMTARSNVISLCTLGNPASHLNSLCSTLKNSSDAGKCIRDPFTPNADNGINCETILGTTVLATLQNEADAYCSRAGDDFLPANCVNLVDNVICIGTNTNPRTNPFDARCEFVANIDTPTTGVRAMFCGLGTNSDDIAACTDTVRATCLATPFASECYATGNPYDLHRAQAIEACAEVAEAERAASDLCMDVVIKAEVTGDNPEPAVTLIDCVGDPFIAACAGRVFGPTRGDFADTCSKSSTKATEPTCMVVVKAAVPMSESNPTLIPAVTVATCVADPFSADCASDGFLNIRHASASDCNDITDKTARGGTVCEQVIVPAVPVSSSNPAVIPAVTVATCVDNPFASACQALEYFFAIRETLPVVCGGGTAGEPATIAACMATIGDTSTTVSDCNTDPFQTNCVSIAAFSNARCTAKPFGTECLANVFYDRARCEADPFYTNCIAHDVYDSARDAICTSPSASNYNVFNVNCTETAYTGTNAARKTLADTCRTKPDTTGCNVAVSDASGAPTIAMCNTNPYATGCDATIFADALTAYCADGANTIFNTNCNSRTGIATARSVAIGECVAALTRDKSDASCTDREIVAGQEENTVTGTPEIPAITVGSCLDDPFNTNCSSPLFQFARDDHMEVCMSNGNAILPSCATLASNDPCVGNPFLADCRSATEGHIYRNARLARYAFCQGERAGDSTELTALCERNGEVAGTTIQNEICAYGGTGAFGDRLNPFASVCGANASAKIDYCGDGDNRNTQDACKDADFNKDVAFGCLENPFATTCTTDTKIDTAVKTRITAKRVAYCSAVDAKDFDATLCNIDADVGVENEICGSQGANANPFSGLCTLDDADFAMERETFVKACAALTGGATRLGANADGATCSAEVIACNTGNGLTTGCIDEPAYASLRQTTITACNNAVIADSIAGGGADTRTAICASITAAGYLDCVTTNPYQNREAGAGVTALDCIGNADYAGVRDELEMACATTGGTRTGDSRCGVLLEGVCGTGTTAGGDAVAGTNPFNTSFCTGMDNVYDAHRKAVIDSCNGSTVTESCTAEINACITSPFNTVVDDGVTTDCTVASYADALIDRRTTYCGTGSTDADVANISLPECQTHAVTTLAGTNPCVANPFGDFTTDVACADTHIGGDIMAAQTLRTTYCSGLADSTSLGIRGDTTNSPICLGAVEAFCVAGDAQFATGTNDNEFNCLTDPEYNSTRAMHYDACAEVAESARTIAGTDCRNAQIEICTSITGNSLQANPWAAICAEQSIDTLAARQAVVEECSLITDATQRGQNPRCKRSGAVLVYNTCNPTSGDPRNADCNDYATTVGIGQPYAAARVERYVADCADSDALTNGSDADFCPEAAVKAEICLGTNGANARPFAPICTQTTVTPNLASAQGLILQICVETTNDNDARCMHSQARTAVTSVRASCSATTGDPFATARPITATGVTATTFNCSTQNQFEPQRVSYTATCKTGSTPSQGTCTGDVITRICTNTIGANADPFNTLCNAVTHADHRLAFANLCDGKTENVAISGTNAATCSAEVIACANNPFGSLCGEVAYNDQKRAVLDMCNSAATIADGGNIRCTTARDDQLCIRDPANCTTGGTVFSEATLDHATYLANLITDRLTYCNTNDNINTKKNICRSDLPLFAYCTRNPWSDGCDTRLGGAGAAKTFRDNRLTYCRLRSAAELRDSNLNVVNSFTAGTLSNTDNFNLCFAASSIDADEHDQHAVGAICAGTDNTTVTSKSNSADPFTAVCMAFSRYHDDRRRRITQCAGEAGTSNGSVFTPASEAAFNCTGYTLARINNCNNAANAGARNAFGYCPAVQTYATWNADTTVAKTAFGSVNATENRFLSGLGGAATLPSTLTQTAYTLNPTANELPSVRFFSAQTAQVLYTCNDDTTPTVSPCTGDGDTIDIASGGTATVGAVKDQAGPLRFYAGIINSTTLDVGAPLFNRATTNAIWEGEIHWVGSHTATNSTLAKRAFKMKVDYSALTIEGAVPITAGNTTGAHLVIDGTYDGAGIMTGATNIRTYSTTPNTSATVINIDATSTATVSPGTLSGIIGDNGAVGVFINDTEAHNIDSGSGGYSGGFIVKPPAGNQ